MAFFKSLMPQKNEIPQDIMNSIQSINKDHINSSLYLLNKAIDIVISYAETYPFTAKKNENILLDYSTLLKLIVQSQPQMASILSFSNHLLYFIDSSKSELDLKMIKQYCNLKKETIRNNTIKIASYFPSIVKKGQKIYTYSSSSIVTQSLITLNEKDIDFLVFCSESRPQNEGINLAETLQKQSIHTTLVTDAYLISHCSDADIIIIGADSIYKNSIINKVGTFPLIHMAKLQSVPTYVLCTRDKIIPKHYQLPQEQTKPKEEMSEKQLNNIAVINTYFDTTPLRLFSGIITEWGIQTPDVFNSSMHQHSIHQLLQP